MTGDSERLRARVEHAFRGIAAVLDDFDALGDDLAGVVGTLRDISRSERQAAAAALLGYGEDLRPRLRAAAEEIAAFLDLFTLNADPEGWLRRQLETLREAPSAE